MLTPSLNKSFKFQSNWPENNSQVYIIQSVLVDINEDKNIKLEEKDGNYILTVKVNHSNNKNLSSQKKLLILHKIRGFCYNTPYLLYFLEILLPLI